MHEGTVDATEILRWSRLLARICDTAMRRTERALLEEGATLTDTLSRFPALERVAAETKDEGFCKWVHHRLETNKAKVLQFVARTCPTCGDVRSVRSLDRAATHYYDRGYTDWCYCEHCGQKFYWGAGPGSCILDR
jgi:uncharacterized protein with PIN domain